MTGKFLIALLVAWLGWRLWKGFGRARPAPAPRRHEGDDVTEARRLLELAPGADAAAIRAAHRRLVAEAHPDRGGDGGAASRLNAARDLLLADLAR